MSILLFYTDNIDKTFIAMLAEDGKKNSLGRVNEVIETVLAEPSRLEELYMAMFADDAWVRMRAADAFEKVCRFQPDWIQSYVDRIQTELDTSQQASIQWHIAQIYCEVELNDRQKQHAVQWLADILNTDKIDWIVAANSMKALAYFHDKNEIATEVFAKLLHTQAKHSSQTIRKKASVFLASLSHK